MKQEYNPELFGIDPAVESRLPIHDLVHLPGYRGAVKVISGRPKPIYQNLSRGNSLALNDFKGMTYIGDDQEGRTLLMKSGLQYTVEVLKDGSFSLKYPIPMISHWFNNSGIQELIDASNNMANGYKRYVVSDSDKVTSVNAYFTAEVVDGKIVLRNNTFFNRSFYQDANDADKLSNATFVWRFINNAAIGVPSSGQGVSVKMQKSQGKDYNHPVIEGVEFDVPLELNRHCYAELTVEAGHISSKYTLDLLPLLSQNAKGGKNE